jgi:hypothetical protein
MQKQFVRILTDRASKPIIENTTITIQLNRIAHSLFALTNKGMQKPATPSSKNPILVKMKILSSKVSFRIASAPSGYYLVILWLHARQVKHF